MTLAVGAMFEGVLLFLLRVALDVSMSSSNAATKSFEQGGVMRDKVVKKPWPYKVRIKRMSIVFIGFSLVVFALALFLSFVTDDPYGGQFGQMLLVSFVIFIFSLLIGGIFGLQAIKTDNVFLRYYKAYRLTLSICAGLNLFAFCALTAANAGASTPWGSDPMIKMPLAGLVCLWMMIYIVHKEKARLDQESEALLAASEDSEEVTSCEL